MIYYCIMLLVPVALSFSQAHKINRFMFGFFMFVLIVFVGFRHEVGTDWGSYIRIHLLLEKASLYEVLVRPEPMSYLIMWLSQRSGLEVYGTNLIGAIILIVGVFSFAKTTPNPWLAIVAAMPFLIFVVGMSATRQGMATGIVFMALSRWQKLGPFSRILWIFLATMFHLSAIVMLAFLVTETSTKLVVRFFLIVLSATLSILSGYFISDSLVSYQQSYISSSSFVVASGAIFHTAFLFIPSLLFWIFRRRLMPHTAMPELIGVGALLGISLPFLLPISTVIVSRMLTYFFFVTIALSASLPQIFTPRSRAIIIVLIVGLNAFVLVGWMMLSNNSNYHRDYQNIIVVF